MPAKLLLLIDADNDCGPVVAEAAAHTDRKLLLAKTSRQALDIIQKEIRNLDLIIIDVDPGAHGVALLEAMSARAERPPMIVVTALEEVYMKPIATEHGAAACVGKPLRLEKLLSALEDVDIHRGLTSNRWGSVIPFPVKEWKETQEGFRGIAGKLSPGVKRRTAKSGRSS